MIGVAVEIAYKDKTLGIWYPMWSGIYVCFVKMIIRAMLLYIFFTCASVQAIYNELIADTMPFSTKGKNMGWMATRIELVEASRT